MMLLVSMVSFAVAALVGWLGGIHRASALAARGGTDTSGALLCVRLSWLLTLGATALLVVCGAMALAGTSSRLELNVMGLMGSASLRVDALSGLFLVISFGVAVPVLLASAALGVKRRARLCSAVALTLLAMQLIITSDNLFLLLGGWEGLGLAFYLLTGFDRERSGPARASVLTLTFSKVSGAALLLGGLLLAAGAHSFTLSALASGAAGTRGPIAYALLLFGFGVKAGFVPMHIWLPPTYASAPGPVRAIMAGVAVNVGFYGMWRVLQILGAPPIPLVCVVLVLAGVTAILGISHSAVHAELTHLIAWSSVENAGLIIAGFGVALVGAAVHSPQLTAAGLLAATAQVCAHALGKSLLFVSTAVVEEASGTTDLDRLRGVVRLLPISGTGLVVGSLTLAGLPLTAGFASEWFILEALMQQFRVHDLALELSTSVAGVLVALTIGVAGIAFVRVIAMTAFGHPTMELPPERRAESVRLDRSPLHVAGVGLLIAGCLGLAVIAPLEVQLIAQGLTPIVGSVTFGALAGSWILQPVFSGFSALSPTWLWIVIPGYGVLITFLVMALSGRRLFRIRRVRAWTSGSPGAEGGTGYTSFGYANAMRKVLANLLLTRGELRREEAEIGGQLGSKASGTAGVRLGYRVDVVDVVEHYLYRPLVPVFFWAVNGAKRLQSGRLDAYMAYMLVALVAVIAVVTALAGR